MFLKKYNIQQKICETKCSLIYKIAGNKIIKIEKEGFNYLKNEIKIRKSLEENTYGILPIIDFGISNAERFVIYDYIEHTIYKRSLSKDELYKLAYTIITIMEYIHKRGIIHCDISAKNILYDSYKKKFYLNDFGHSKHITFYINEKGNKPMVGCPLFCSEYIHLGYEYAPRDDFISFAYVLIYSINNTLPWSGKNNLTNIYESKKNLRTHILSYSFIPNEIKIFCNYCFHLKPNQKINYAILKKVFKSGNIEIPIGT